MDNAMRYQKEHIMENQNFEKKPYRPLYHATRMILLAAVGAASLAQDEMKDMMDRLVERGELAEAESRKMMREYLDRRERIAKEREEDARKAPKTASTADMEALNARIAELTRQIEELKREKAA
jgi:polyhydroxyalkanoate synthesis regulator phasin